MRELRSSRSSSVLISSDDILSTMVLRHFFSTFWAGCYGAYLAEGTSVCFFPNRSAPGSSGESLLRLGLSSISSPILTSQSMVLAPSVSH